MHNSRARVVLSILSWCDRLTATAWYQNDLRCNQSSFFIFLAFAFFLCNVPPIHVQARLVSRSKRIANHQRDATSDDTFASASWIWAPNSNGLASTSTRNVAFLKGFPTPTGKTASSAVISVTAVGKFTLWMNGQPIGASEDIPDGWTFARVLRAQLNATGNLFSVLVENSGKFSAPPPGLLASIQVSYTDSTTSSLVSDPSWLATSNIPVDFPTPLELSHFEAAAVSATYKSSQGISFPSPDPAPLTLNDSSWIWSTRNADTAADPGTVGFRKTFPSPIGKSAQSATVLMTADNFFQLYINGKYIGSPPGSSGGWQYAQQFTVNLNTTLNTFTVLAQNFPDPNQSTTGSPAAFLGAINVIYADGTSQIRTDSSWLNGNNVASLPEFLSISDANLSPSFVQGPLGMSPWGPLDGISDVLSAASVPAPPFISSSTPSPSPSPFTSKHTLPVGATIGIAWGVFIVLLVAFLVWWRRRRNGKGKVGDREAKTSSPAVSELPRPFPMGASSYEPLHAQNRSDTGADIPAPTMHRNGPLLNDGVEAPPPSYTDAQSATAGSASGRSVVAVNGPGRNGDVVPSKGRW
ncbi:hypothetical protein B0H14DRAFT_1287262 [Mycena olivaceomarginata]|nr:hypothetical protein B0H14DRAFT_1287262 [Mycena olivaceomarginata]